MIIGQRIKQRRKELKLSADELASRIGKNRATIFRYENGEIEKFSFDVLLTIAEALQTTPSFLMGREEQSEPHSISAIGEKIKAARIAKGMTQEDLGKLLGVQRSAIAKYEKGRVVNIKRSTLKKLSDVLEISPSELIFEEVQKESDIAPDIAARLIKDKEFLELVEILNNLDNKKIQGVKQMLQAFL